MVQVARIRVLDASASLTRPVLATWKLKRSGFLRKQSAGQEDDAEQEVNAVIGLAKM
jgi:hypothetical protein